MWSMSSRELTDAAFERTARMPACIVSLPPAAQLGR